MISAESHPKTIARNLGHPSLDTFAFGAGQGQLSRAKESRHLALSQGQLSRAKKSRHLAFFSQPPYDVIPPNYDTVGDFVVVVVGDHVVWGGGCCPLCSIPFRMFMCFVGFVARHKL